MPTTDTSEKGLENIIAQSLVKEAGYVQGESEDFDRDHAVDLCKFMTFLNATQPNLIEQFRLNEEGPKKLQFMARLQGEIAKRGSFHATISST